MPRATRLSQELKLDVIEKHRNGWKPAAILRHILQRDRTVTLKNIIYIIKAYQTGTFFAVRQIERRPMEFNEVTEEHIRCVQDNLRRDPTMSSKDLIKILLERGLVVSDRTMLKIIAAAGWTAAKPQYCQLIRDANKLKRTEFCQELIVTNEHFSDAIFTDESTIQLHDNKTVCYRPINGIATPQCRPKHPLKIHLWGGISRRGKTPLLIFEGIMEKTFYTEEILHNTLHPFIQRKFADGHRFVQDNDPKHTSLHARQFMTDNNINWWKWPAESCDLNPIEMVWNMLKRDVSKRQPTTKEELITFVQDFWRDRLTPEVCNTFIDHIFKVVPVVRAVNGRASGNIPKKLFREPSRGRSIQYFSNKLHAPEFRQQLDRLIQ